MQQGQIEGERWARASVSVEILSFPTMSAILACISASVCPLVLKLGIQLTNRLNIEVLTSDLAAGLHRQRALWPCGPVKCVFFAEFDQDHEAPKHATRHAKKPV